MADPGPFLHRYVREIRNTDSSPSPMSPTSTKRSIMIKGWGDDVADPGPWWDLRHLLLGRRHCWGRLLRPHYISPLYCSSLKVKENTSTRHVTNIPREDDNDMGSLLTISKWLQHKLEHCKTVSFNTHLKHTEEKSQTGQVATFFYHLSDIFGRTDCYRPEEHGVAKWALDLNN